MNFNVETVATAIATAALSIGGAVLGLRRLISSQNLDVTKDTAGKTLIQNLMSERDGYKKDAETAWAHRVADAEQIARLKAENDALIERVRTLGSDDLSNRLRISNLRRALAESKPGALDDLDSDYAPLK